MASHKSWQLATLWGAVYVASAVRAPKHFNQAALMDPPLIYGRSSFVHVAKTLDKVPMMNTAMDKMSPSGISKTSPRCWDSRDDA